MYTGNLPKRQGARPATTPTNPHTQLEQIAPEHLQEEIWRRMQGLSNVETGPSLISVPGARAIFAPERHRSDDCAACMVGREFAHLHPPSDGSLHLTLPNAAREEAISKGWAEPHPLVATGKAPETVVMVYGPRSEEELDVVWSIICKSHEFACGKI